MPPKKRANGHDFLSQAKAFMRREKVDLPKGMTAAAYVRTLSARETHRIVNACLLPGKVATDENAFDSEKASLYMVAAALVGEDGTRLIPEGRESEIDDLPQAVVLAINQAYSRLNEPPPGN